MAATAEKWPATDGDWPYASGVRNAAVGQFAPSLPWVVITDTDGRAIYSGGLPTKAELAAAFEVIGGD